MPAPLITIKKSDGTIEKITLAEFLARKQKAGSRPASPAGRQQTTDNRPQITPPPVKRSEPAQKPAIPAQKPSFNKDDAKSLLDEPALASKGGLPSASDQRWPQVETIAERLNFPVANPRRLRGLIQLRLKDVRAEAETRDWLIRPLEKGGLGLLPNQAEEILKLCRQAMAGGHSNEVPLLKKPMPFMNQRPVVPADRMISAPVAPPALAKTSTSPLLIKEGVNKPTTAPLRGAPPLQRPVRDVVTPQPARQTTVGPVEEIRLLTLTDFRRLASDPAKAAGLLKQKFLNLKTESYLFYLDAMSAWRQSPLYLEYTGKVAEALNSGKKLAEVLQDKSKVQLNEMTAIMEMEKGL